MKTNIKNGKNVSMGFGFIEFDSVETATNVCKDLQVPYYKKHFGYTFPMAWTRQFIFMFFSHSEEHSEF